MNCFNKLFLPCRLSVTGAHRIIKPSLGSLRNSRCLDLLQPKRDTLQLRTMAQKSITSFFKITPKKDPKIKKEKAEHDTSLEDIEMPEPPVQNGNKSKRSSKRQRIESSSSESQSPKKESPPTSVTKKKVKRQRIESSESESEPVKLPEKSPEKSPVQSPVKEIKIEKSENVKTYQSPKSKKAKGRKETKNENIKKATKKDQSPSSKSPSVKKEKSPLKENGKDKTPEDKKKGVKKEDIVEKEAIVKKEGGVKIEKEDGEKSPLKEIGKDKTPEDKKKGANKEDIVKKEAIVKKEVGVKNEKEDGEKTPLKENGKDKTPEDKKKGVKKEDIVKKEAVVKKEGSVKNEKEDGLVPETEYNPTKPKYHPIKDACWAEKQPVPYLALAKTLEAIEAISARLKIVEILSNYFRSVIALTPEDLLPSVYLCLNQLAPAYHSLELGIAETYLMKAIGQCTGRTLAQMKAAAQKTGDLGAVAEQARSTQRTMFTPPPLKTRAVFNALKEIAGMTGQASVNKKIGKIQSLYVACRFSESRYLIRSLEGKLRIGLAEQSVLQALAQAAASTPPGTDVLDAGHGLSAAEFKAIVDEQALIIKTTYCECPNYEMIIPVLLEHGVKALPHHCKLTPGIPLKPMLAHPTKGVHEVLNRFEGTRFTCEYKYDGERAQIHVPKTVSDGNDAADLTNASIFSRNQENNTTKYPDILQRLPSLLKPEVSSCVLDCEAVAYDTVNKQILPFQILSTRKRKDASTADIKVQVCVFVFDLLYLNGKALVREPLEQRRRLLRENFNEVEGEWQFATAKDCSSMDEVQQFLDDAVKGSCEGLMVKTLEGDHARYDIARRSHNWLKLKKDYLEGVGDTIDVVVIGGYHGRGKRRGVYGGFLLACYDGGSEEYQALCKIGTGFSDEDLQTLTKTLEEHVIETPRNYYRYDASHCADAWFAPACVWEVRCADLSLSPAHRAALGLVDPERGVSLRFPRFIRVRDDKTPEQATSAQQIAEMYLAQDQVKNSTSKPVNFDDFY